MTNIQLYSGMNEVIESLWSDDGDHHVVTRKSKPRQTNLYIYRLSEGKYGTRAAYGNEEHVYMCGDI